jgi:cardiolipin synthase
VRRLRDAGCRVAWYRGAQWFNLLHYDQRTHRRQLIIDGRLAFTGGAGIADQWAGDADGPGHWRDTHVQLAGPAVAEIQAGFTESWTGCTEELLLAARDHPSLEPTDGLSGGTSVTVVMSTPADGASSAQRTMAACIASAASSLRITNAYVLPTPAFVEALRAAAARGVAVRIIMPGPYHNKPLVRRASRHTWRALLAGGVELYEHQRTMVHAKTVIIDADAALVGSINFDPRSFSLNAEAAVVLTDASIAVEMTRVFGRDLAHCAPVDAAALSRLSPLARLGDAVCYWFRAQL